MDSDLLESWKLSLRASNKAPATIDCYLTDAGWLVRWLESNSRVNDLTEVTSRHVEAFLAGENNAGRAAATLARRYRSLVQLFGWLEREGEIVTNPMSKMKPPIVPVQPPPVISDADVEKLLNVCAGKKFENLRDTAIIRLLHTTGIRAGELIGMGPDDVNLGAGIFSVMGKGRRGRTIALLPKASAALDAYLRARKRHPQVASPALWVGSKGALSVSGLAQLLERRCVAAGLEPINPHRFRHTFAHNAKSLGMNDGDLMSVAGWRSAQMLVRYGASAQAERGREAHHRLMDGKEV